MHMDISGSVGVRDDEKAIEGQLAKSVGSSLSW